MTVIGVSTKMYFGYRETLDWLERVAGALADQPGAEVFVLPGFPVLPAAIELVAGTSIAIGAQDLAAGDDGAQTGEVSAAELVEIGCAFAEVGHAERRRLFGETEEVVAAKTATALRHGLTPVLCLGEVQRVPAAVAAVECVRQLRSALSRAPEPVERLVLAYEPQWAIGAAEPAPIEHIAEVCRSLRTVLDQENPHPDSAVIYGGSAGPGLLTALAGNVDGLFLGRFGHDPAAVAAVLAEAAALPG